MVIPRVMVQFARTGLVLGGLVIGLAAQVPAPVPKKGRVPVPQRTVPKPKPAPSPEIPGEIREFPIATLAVEGVTHYAEAAIVRLSGLKPGDAANKPAFESARDRLLATGAFDSVGYRYFTASDGRSYEAVFQLIESAPLYPFRADGLPGASAELNRFLATKDPLFISQLPPTRSRIEVYAAWIQEFAAGKGFAGTVVGKVEAEGPGQLAIVFRPGGEWPVVSDVTFRGNTAVPTAALKPAILGVALGVPFQESRFRQLLDTSLRPIYEARGRLSVRFGAITTQPSASVKGFDVAVAIEEGEVFEIGEIRLIGTAAASSQLLKTAEFQTGDLANMERVQEGLDRMRNSLRREGYLMAVVTPDRHLRASERKVDLTIDVQPGDRYEFGKLTIEGLDIESEPVIRKMWALKPGEPFNPDYPDLFLKRIVDDQVFENLKATRADLDLRAESKVANVTLRFGRAAEKKSLLKN